MFILNSPPLKVPKLEDPTLSHLCICKLNSISLQKGNQLDVALHILIWQMSIRFGDVILYTFHFMFATPHCDLHQ